MWLGTKEERNLTPDEFQARITEAGGLNRYDEPNFRIVWSQTELIRAGGEWTPPGQPSFRGYRDIPLGLDPCWVLQQWQPAEKYGTPESYYVDNYDWDTGLQILGEYPYSGRYETVIPLTSKTIVNGRLVVEHMQLSSLLVDLVVPIIKESAALTFARYKQLRDEHKERLDRAQVSQIESSLQNAFPAFGTASRSAAHLACNSVVQKRAENIERYWKSAVRTLKQRGKGLSTGELTQ